MALSTVTAVVLFAMALSSSEASNTTSSGRMPRFRIDLSTIVGNAVKRVLFRSFVKFYLGERKNYGSCWRRLTCEFGRVVNCIPLAQLSLEVLSALKMPGLATKITVYLTELTSKGHDCEDIPCGKMPTRSEIDYFRVKRQARFQRQEFKRN